MIKCKYQQQTATCVMALDSACDFVNLPEKSFSLNLLFVEDNGEGLTSGLAFLVHSISSSAQLWFQVLLWRSFSVTR